MKKYYKLFKPPCCLQKLTEEMLKGNKTAPKLKVKGAECRHLVAFGFQLAQEMHEKLQTPHTNTVLQCMVHLYDFYMLISGGNFDAKLAKDACMGFCTMFSALSREAEREGKQLWVMKPKIHMFQELNQRTTLTDDKTS